MTKKQHKSDTAAQVSTGQLANEIETLSNTEPFLTMTDQLNVASPDVFCRTGLFGASAARERVLLEPNEKVVVACDPATGYQVELEGGLNCNIPGPLGAPLRGQKVSSRLDQADYTVYLGLLRLTRGMLGATVVLEPYAFVKSLGLDDTKPNVYSTFKAIARMNATRLTVVQPKHGHPGKFVCCVGYLVSSIAYDSSSQTYTIALDPQLAGLFQKSYFNQLAWQQRLALSTSLSRWLHAELNSHRSGYCRWSHLLQQAFGSQSPERVFRTRLREAVVEVRKVTGWDIRLEENDANYNLKLVCFKSAEDVVTAEMADNEPAPAPAPTLRRATPSRKRLAQPAANQGEFSFAVG